MENILQKNDTKKEENTGQAKWYIVTSITGNEDAVYKNIEDKVRAYQLGEVVQEMRLLKTKEITIEVFDSINNPPPRVMRNSKSITWETLPGNRYKKTRIREINRFPGYIYIKMVMMADAWYIIRNTYGVTGFVGSSGKGAQPIPMSDEEVDNLFNPANNQDIIINKSEDDTHVELTVDKEVNKEKKVEFLASIDDNQNINDDGFFDSSLKGKEVEMNFVPTLEEVNINATPEDYFYNHEQEIVETFVDENKVEGQNVVDENNSFDIYDQGDSINKSEEFSVGNTVSILANSWKDLEGVIVSINKENRTAKVSVEVFGRENNIELSFDEIRKKI